jgi:hypothetical protein
LERRALTRVRNSMCISARLLAGMARFAGARG